MGGVQRRRLSHAARPEIVGCVGAGLPVVDAHERARSARARPTDEHDRGTLRNERIQSRARHVGDQRVALHGLGAHHMQIFVLQVGPVVGVAQIMT